MSKKANPETVCLASLSVWVTLLIVLWSTHAASAQSEQTYAERLGWKKGERVVIFLVDDVGMSYDSNQGALQAIEEGVATSMSVMMPCPWVPVTVSHLKRIPTSMPASTSPSPLSGKTTDAPLRPLHTWPDRRRRSSLEQHRRRAHPRHR